MKTETITRLKLTASEGMVLKNGDNYAETVFLTAGQTEDDWTEVPREEYDAFLKAEEEKALAEMPRM